MSLEIATIGGLSATAFILIFLSSIMDRERYGILRTLFVMLSLFILTVNMQMVSAFLRIAGGDYVAMAQTFDVLYTVMLYGTVFVLLWIILIFVWGVFADARRPRKYEYHKDEG